MGARLLTREVSTELAALLVPAEPGLPSQKQVEALYNAGFVPLFDESLLAPLVDLGAVIAKTRTDGVLWVYARAAHGDGCAVWVFKDDHNFLLSFVGALTPGRLASEGAGPAIALLESRLGTVGAFDFTDEVRLGLSTVIQLGTPDAVIRYLESLG